jgi:phospho-N-acetylmuramoyl-pentapeptide-transferase
MNAATFAYAGYAFILAMIIGWPVVRTLRAYHLGKRIKEEQPESHQVKAGTPTMGGVIFLAPLAMITALAGVLGYGATDVGVAWVMTTCAGFQRGP